MQAADAAAIDDLGIPRLLLMDHAGLAVARHAAALLCDPSAPIAICCGTGYNGGDGLSAARHLQGWGYRPRVILTESLSRLRDEPAVFARIALRLKIAIHEVTATPDEAAGRALQESAVIIDALLGIGLKGLVRQPVAGLIERINQAQRPVVAVDVPSGLNGDTGAVQGVAVKATLTVTFGCLKRGCLIGQGPAHAGRLIVEEITFPHQVLPCR